MRTYVTGMLLACGLVLGGCAGQSAVTGGTGGISVPSSTDVAATIAEVQSVTKQVCAFVPTAQTVASILSALGVPGVSVAGDIAGQICSAVTSKSARRGGARVHGVAIKGRFTR